MEKWNGFSTAPTTSALGDTASEGTDPRVARADHRHGREAAILTTRGDVLYRDATTQVRLALGANGTFLQSNGTDLVYGAAPTPAFVSLQKWGAD